MPMAAFRPMIAAFVCSWSALAAASGDTPQKAGDETVLFGDLPAVEAASLHAQTLAEAPANVTVITAQEIRRYGYRTLGEALASVRGFYVTYDHTYHYVGVRGIALPGDFNTRFLVMLNGHPLTDNIYNSNGFFGQDFGLDMDLVERIEIIRGPTSALYGSNGMLANINVVTRSPVDAERLRLSAETDSFGGRKASLSMSKYLGSGVNLLVSGSVFNNVGISFPANGLAVPAGVGNSFSNADGERGYHTFANLIWRGWSFTAYFNSRDKQPPVGLGTSLSGDPGQYAVDSRNLLSAAYKRQAGPGELRWQISYDSYRYHDRYDYPQADAVEPVCDYNRGDWVDSQLTYELPVAIGPLTLGLQGAWNLRALQYNLVDGIEQDIAGRPDRSVAVFAQQQWNLSPRWKLYGRRARRSQPELRLLRLAAAGPGLSTVRPHGVQAGIRPALPQSQRVRAVLQRWRPFLCRRPAAASRSGEYLRGVPGAPGDAGHGAGGERIPLPHRPGHRSRHPG